MLKQIDKRGNTLIKLFCDQCHWVKWLKPKAAHKYPECPNCHGKRLEETVKQLKETPKNLNEVIVEDIEVNDQRHVETEVIKKPKKKFDK
jgi:hypothetical protein